MSPPPQHPTSSIPTGVQGKTAAKRNVFDWLVIITEAWLSRRKRKKRLRREKQKSKNVILDWIEAFLWAAGMVLLANQYLMQAYQIPSGSMINTLLIGDHLFVNKIIYGPELLPGFAKLPSPIKPKRNDIIIFENPSYIGRGTVFNIAQRVIYMLTLSFVDIDRDEHGEVRPHFLIKRAVGVSGDRFTIEQGNMRMRPAGLDRWMSEREFFTLAGKTHTISRLIDESSYGAIEAAGKATAFRELGLEIPEYLIPAAVEASGLKFYDSIAFEKARLAILRGAYPHSAVYAARYARLQEGIYVSEGRILPLGDNRDNSRDGRHFGPVKLSRVLGRAAIIYWPGDFRVRHFDAFDRFGSIQ